MGEIPGNIRGWNRQDSGVDSGVVTVKRSIYLALDASSFLCQEIIRGVSSYFSDRNKWILRTLEIQPTVWTKWLEYWHGDGLILLDDSGVISREVAQRGIPAVDLSERRDNGLHTIYSDHHAAASMVIQHFLGQNKKNMAFFGEKGNPLSKARSDAFLDLARNRASKLRFYEIDSTDSVILENYLKKLPVPCGIYAATDELGVRIIQALHDILRGDIPYQIAVVGAGNNVRLCETASPSLSSVDVNTQQLGYEAARLLERILQGRPILGHLPPKVVPGSLIDRGSSMSGNLDDQMLMAVDLIRQRACSGLTVPELIKATGLPRRTLERRFQDVLKISPYADILRTQLEYVKRLLRETEATLDEIASMAGFHSVSHLCVSFKRSLKCTPGVYRKKVRE